MHVVCVCVCVWNYRRFATFDRHKVVMDITFAAWCEVNTEFAELLFL